MNGNTVHNNCKPKISKFLIVSRNGSSDEKQNICEYPASNLSERLWRSNENFPAEIMKRLLLKDFSITSVATHPLVHTQKKKIRGNHLGHILLA